MNAIVRPLVEHLMRRALRRGFRRVCWVGPAPDLPDDLPVVAYANHHSFFDGYLMWLVVDRVLGRRGITWMEDWDRFPFFAAAGALPFPPDDARRRAATLRRTARRMHRDPKTALVYFPEGRLHAPEDGLIAPAPGVFTRLDRLLPETRWWPVGIRLTWWGEAAPTALLCGGAPHTGPTGDEAARLRRALAGTHAARPGEVRVLLEGRRSPQERWNFGFLGPLFDAPR